MRYDYIVLYASQTGNTKKLATEIFSMLPGRDKDLKPIEEFSADQETETYFIGFWTDHGSCGMDVADLISSLHGKKIALFGTCGAEGTPEYYGDISRKASAWIPADSQFLGAFFCQGKMPIQIRNKYEEMYEGAEDKELIARMLHNFDQALLHPNQEDYDKARGFVESALRRIRETTGER
mgnify:CR=1 FL=1